MEVDDTTFVISGKTSPGSAVTILEDGAVIGTATADSSGKFSKEFSAQEPGVHSYSVYSTDVNGISTSTISYSVSLSSHTETKLFNVILPPTVQLSAQEIAADKDLAISGWAVPGATVTLLFSRTTKTVTAGSDGYWEALLDPGLLGVGDYEIYARAATPDGYQSEASEVLNFEVVPSLTVPSAAPEEEGPKLPGFMSVFDPDGDGRISKSEVFDAVKSWVGSWRDYLSVLVAGEQLQETPLERRTCDLNNDGKCNLRDFSILLYYIEIGEEGG